MLILFGSQEGPQDFIGELYLDLRDGSPIFKSANLGEPWNLGEFVHSDILDATSDAQDALCILEMV